MHAHLPCVVAVRAIGVEGQVTGNDQSKLEVVQGKKQFRQQLCVLVALMHTNSFFFIGQKLFGMHGILLWRDLSLFISVERRENVS